MCVCVCVRVRVCTYGYFILRVLVLVHVHVHVHVLLCVRVCAYFQHCITTPQTISPLLLQYLMLMLRPHILQQPPQQTTPPRALPRRLIEYGVTTIRGLLQIIDLSCRI